MKLCSYYKGFVFLTIIILTTSINAASSCVTYKLAGGRFGDQVWNYYKAKKIAATYLKADKSGKVPFLYKPFIYSDKLVMHHKETMYTKAEARRYGKAVQLKDNFTQEMINNDNGKLYVSSYFLNVPGWDECSFDCADDPILRQELREMVAPIVPIKKMKLPKGFITVAVHVRRGSGQDSPLFSEEGNPSVLDPSRQDYLDVGFPEKAPSLNFYVDQLRKLCELLNNHKMYVYIFTDDKNPRELMSKMNSALGAPNIEFDCRKDNDTSKDNLLEDFFYMTQFDCLIRPDSNFSKCTEVLADYKIVIYLKRAHWADGQAIIDEVGIKINQ